jgi:hypothetical protein
MIQGAWRRLRFNLLWSIQTPQDREYVTQLLMNSRNWQTEIPVREILAQLEYLDDYFWKVVWVTFLGIHVPLCGLAVILSNYRLPPPLLVLVAIAFLLTLFSMWFVGSSMVWILREEHKYRLLYIIAQRRD